MLSCPLPLILASKSPRRKKLLRQIGLHFRIIPSGADETFQKEISPAHNARNVALRKARDVAGRLKKGIVIGADTIVVLNRNILGKPVSSGDAKRMLQDAEREKTLRIYRYRSCRRPFETGMERGRTDIRKIPEAFFG